MIDELNTLRKDVQQYLDLNLELVKLSIAEALSRFLSTLIKVVIVILVASVILLFLSICSGIMAGRYFEFNCCRLSDRCRVRSVIAADIYSYCQIFT